MSGVACLCWEASAVLLPLVAFLVLVVFVEDALVPLALERGVFGTLRGLAGSILVREYAWSRLLAREVLAHARWLGQVILLGLCSLLGISDLELSTGNFVVGRRFLIYARLAIDVLGFWLVFRRCLLPRANEGWGL